MESINKGIQELYNKLNAWVEDIIKMFPNLLIAAFVLCFFWLLSKWVYKTTKRILVRSEINPNLRISREH